MNRKIIASIIVFAIAFGSPIQVLALEKASRDALTFFKRYESEFANNMRRLEEYDRKMKLVTGAKAEDLKYDAEDIMDQVQRRYDLLEDQYSFTISNYPSDAAELRDGFGRIDDSYRKIRNFYNDKFKEGNLTKALEPLKQEPVKPQPVKAQPVKMSAPAKSSDVSYQEALAALKRPAGQKTEEVAAKPAVAAVVAVPQPVVAPASAVAKPASGKFAEALAALKTGRDDGKDEEAEINRKIEEKKAEIAKKLEAERLEAERAKIEAEREKMLAAKEAARQAVIAKVLEDEKAAKEAEEKRSAAIKTEEQQKLYAAREAERAKIEAEREKMLAAKEAERQAVIARVLAEQNAKSEQEKMAERSKFESALAGLKKPAVSAASVAASAAVTSAASAADTAVAKANVLAATVSAVASKAVSPQRVEVVTKAPDNEYDASYIEALGALKRDPAKKTAFDMARDKVREKIAADTKSGVITPTKAKPVSAAVAYTSDNEIQNEDDNLVVAVKPEAREDVKQLFEPAPEKDAVETAMDMADVLKAIEARQAVEAEKIRAARKAQALAEAEKAKKEAELAARKAELEAERISRRAALAADADYGKVKMTGSVALEARDREEKYEAQSLVGVPTTEYDLPNNLSQLRLILTYQTDENHAFTLDERYLQRERNEVVRENYLNLSYMMKESDERVWSIKNSFQTTSYPDSLSKDYRDNNFEVFLNRKPDLNRESLSSFGYRVRSYPNYERSNFHEFALSNQETWLTNDSIMFAEAKLENRKYRTVNDLDYGNANLYVEFNKSYANEAEVSVSNTFDRRSYNKESVNLYRTSYYDNYLRFAYTLPMHSVLTYVFEAQHNKHEYGSDSLRGYSELDLFLATKMKLTKKTRAQIDYRFIDNDENSRNMAHKNNKVHFMVQKNVNDTLRFRFDHTYHARDTVVGNSMNFDDHNSIAKMMWRFDRLNVSWNTGFNSRIYDETAYVDYKNMYTGFDIGYERPERFEWKLSPALRKIEFRNYYKQNKVDPVRNWEDELQPSVEFEYIKPLNEDLKFTFTASYEKTFYKTYDSNMQDLLWNFAKPMVITEFMGKIEQSF
ncbi:MAG: hypothetical protein ACOX2I_13100 [Candidatus Ozemobacteraceae bacterium]